MKIQLTLIPVIMVLLISCTTELKVPERQMIVTSGPEKVFTSPVTELVPLLENSTATGENGRVGTEFVFWGYQLATGEDVFLYGCAVLDDVNCESRLTRVCAGPETTLFETIQPGQVRYLNCRAIGRVGAGDLLPNCEDRERTSDVKVGLVSCP